MSRFSRAFLREKLGGRVCVAAFGKHPAWDDHIGLLGAQTETLALLEDVLYRQGIAGQIASGRWRDRGSGAKTPAFNHRFVWSRGEQSVVGVLWPSTDGKGRGQFPFVCCVQAGVRGTAAVQVYLEYVEKIGQQARDAPNQTAVEEILEHGGVDLNPWKPVEPSAIPVALPKEQAPAVRDALCVLAQAAVRSKPSRPLVAAGVPVPPLRIPSLTDRPSANLCFYAGFLDQFSLAAPIYLLITSAEAGAAVDCVVGEPGPDAFFFLGAGSTELTIATPPAPAGLPERCRQNIDGFLAACASGALPRPVRRSFWQRFA